MKSSFVASTARLAIFTESHEERIEIFFDVVLALRPRAFLNLMRRELKCFAPERYG